MSTLATAIGKCFDGKFTITIAFPMGYFILLIPDADIESPQSLHTLFDKYLDYILMKLERNRKVRTILNVELIDKKWLTIFDNVLMPF